MVEFVTKLKPTTAELKPDSGFGSWRITVPFFAAFTGGTVETASRIDSDPTMAARNFLFFNLTS
jgi:hypothetical protein